MTPAQWSAEVAPGVRRALLVELVLLLDNLDAWRCFEGNVYLDYCAEVFDVQEGETAEDAEIAACDDCPIGGGLDCPGVWRWRGSHRVVTQADVEHASRLRYV